MLTFTNSGFYCEPGRFYIDPWRPVDRAVITHGHGDHARPGMGSYLCHTHTVPVLRSRLGEDIQVEGVPYGRLLSVNGVKVSLHPAGHIVGSAQVRMEYRGKVVVISGDYKTQDDGLSTPLEIIRCHEFVTESTFGLPIYNWTPVATQNEALRSWVAGNQAAGKTSVLVGYSLGKAQRIMKALESMAPLHVHASIGRLNQAYESAGVTLPEYKVINFYEDVRHLNGAVVIVPPSLLHSNLLQKIPNRAEALCSGWMQVRGARRWRSADAGFAISDHADWNGLLQTITATEAEKVYVTHGQTAVFARYLNEAGIPAGEVKTEFGDEEGPESIPAGTSPDKMGDA
ncbi:ligase-associated DNA damage response exonuclease [Ravibacter arvi]|uniref:Ligase-associated DNA damage response exonuclease n=1 Tax=Ravibacter arvi TaxID=2051041 RepID=A0ABP8LUG5_9BACT